MIGRRRVVIGLVGLVLLEFGLLLLVGFALIALSTSCDDGGISIDTPPGWEVSRDYQNNCQWTLFNAAGDRAPDELYDTVSIDAPSQRPIDRTATGYILIVLSLGGMIAVLVVGRRRTADIEPRSTGYRARDSSGCFGLDPYAAIRHVSGIGGDGRSG